MKISSSECNKSCPTGYGDNNKTKDWALVQTAALVINKGVEVRLSLVR